MHIMTTTAIVQHVDAALTALLDMRGRVTAREVHILNQQIIHLRSIKQLATKMEAPNADGIDT